jgi:hypothetical protein
VVTQCKDEPPIPGLPSAEDAFTDATTMCTDHWMPECDACNPQPPPGTVVAQALQVQCPDPLAAVGLMCTDHWMAECAGTWQVLCNATVAEGGAAGFPTLCGGKSHGHSDHDSEGEGKSPAASGPPTSSVQASPDADACYSDPTAADCADFAQADDRSTAEIAGLCIAMPFMVGCTLWAQCQVSGFLHGSLLFRLSLLPSFLSPIFAGE